MLCVCATCDRVVLTGCAALMCDTVCAFVCVCVCAYAMCVVACLCIDDTVSSVCSVSMFHEVGVSVTRGGCVVLVWVYDLRAHWCIFVCVDIRL